MSVENPKSSNQQVPTPSPPGSPLSDLERAAQYYVLHRDEVLRTGRRAPGGAVDLAATGSACIRTRTAQPLFAGNPWSETSGWLLERLIRTVRSGRRLREPIAHFALTCLI